MKFMNKTFTRNLTGFVILILVLSSMNCVDVKGYLFGDSSEIIVEPPIVEQVDFVLSLDKSSERVPSVESSVSVQLTATPETLSWSVTSDQAYCNASPESGAGSQSITVAISGNLSTIARECILTFTTQSTGSETFTVTQERDTSGCIPAVTPADVTGLNGSGTEVDPYQLCGAGHLNLIATPTALGQHYLLASNIDLMDNPFTPIAGAFTGSLEGLGFTIQNLTIEGSTSALRVALFETLGSSGIIRNLSIEGIDIQTLNTSNSTKYIGSLVAFSEGMILNCSATDIDPTVDLSGKYW